MTEETKQKLAEARARAREARKVATDAELAPSEPYDPEVNRKYGGSDAAEIETLRAELAALKNKHREKAAHEHDVLTGKEKVNDHTVNGAQANVEEALRKIVNEQLAATFPERQPVRTTARESMRPGAAVGYDREGNPLYRKRDQTADPFSIPDDLQDPDYEFQWIRVSTYGQEDISNQIVMQEQGWRFVPAEREKFRGRFMPSDYTGHIFRDGLALVERPKVLCDEARRESAQRVKEQSTAQRQQFGMALPSGFEKTQTAQQFTFARSGKVESTPDSLKPSLRPALDID